MSRASSDTPMSSRTHVLQVLCESGDAIAVDNEQALEAVREVMLSDGLFICPEAATTIVALRELIKANRIDREEEVVVVNTGTRLKYASLFPLALRRVAEDMEETVQ